MNLVLFDLDNTLLAGDSDVLWPQYLIDKGLMNPVEHSAKNDFFYQQYQSGTLDIDAFLVFQLSPLTLFTRPKLDQMHREYMRDYILPIITQQARELVKKHQDNQDEVMIITATNRFITEPIAAEFGIQHLIAVEPEKDEAGNYTGRYSGLPSFKQGKIDRLNQWLAERHQTLMDYEQVWFYSDSLNDLPLLSLVSHPVAVDPDPVLREHAQKKGWPIISLRGAF